MKNMHIRHKTQDPRCARANFGIRSFGVAAELGLNYVEMIKMGVCTEYILGIDRPQGIKYFVLSLDSHEEYKPTNEKVRKSAHGRVHNNINMYCVSLISIS